MLWRLTSCTEYFYKKKDSSCCCSSSLEFIVYTVKNSYSVFLFSWPFIHREGISKQPLKPSFSSLTILPTNYFHHHPQLQRCTSVWLYLPRILASGRTRLKAATYLSIYIRVLPITYQPPVFNIILVACHPPPLSNPSLRLPHNIQPIHT